MKETIKDIAGLFGLTMLLGMGITLYLIEIWAYLSGTWEITVTFNKYGEGMVEFIISIIALILGIWGIYWYTHESMLEEHEEIDNMR